MAEKAKILIIEDEAVLTQALENIFKADYSVSIAADGIDGLNKIRNEKPDLVLLDIFLPSMNGMDILEQIKNDPETKDIPVIILSNCGGERDIKRGLDLGAIEYMVKADIELADLVEKVAEVLQSD